MNSTAKQVLRIILGGYLTFIGGNLIWEMISQKPSDMVFKICMGVLFMVVGLAYAIWTIKSWIQQVKKETEEETKAEALREAKRKQEAKQKRDQMKFRTAPMPSPSEIVKGMVTITEEEADERDKGNTVAPKNTRKDVSENTSEDISGDTFEDTSEDTSENPVSVQIASEKTSEKRLESEKNSNNKSEPLERDFEEV